MQYDREEMKTNMKSAVATVVFEKTDGTLRTLRCTLMTQYLPEQKESKTGRKKVATDEVLNVWDLDNDGWRSFRLDSVKKISYSPL